MKLDPAKGGVPAFFIPEGAVMGKDKKKERAPGRALCKDRG